MNNLILVGKLKSKCEKVDNHYEFLIGVKRIFKDDNGEYQEDTFKVVTIIHSDLIEEALQVGNTVGVRGSLREDNGNVYVFADKLTFLSTKTNEESGE